MGTRMVLHVALQCATGLAHMHARGYAHMDVKLANVLYCSTEGGELPLIKVSRAEAIHQRCLGAACSQVATCWGASCLLYVCWPALKGAEHRLEVPRLRCLGVDWLVGTGMSGGDRQHPPCPSPPPLPPPPPLICFGCCYCSLVVTWPPVCLLLPPLTSPVLPYPT